MSNPFEPPVRSARRILALDPGRFTGFCHGSDELTYGVWQLPTGPSRMTRLEQEMEAVIARIRPSVIAYEIAALGAKGFHAVHAHAELCGTIKAVAAKHSIPCWGFHIGSWKKISLGAGNLKPEQYRAKVKFLYGIATSSADEAAAIGVWQAAKKGPPPVTKKKQAKRVKKALAKRQPRLF